MKSIQSNLFLWVSLLFVLPLSAQQSVTITGSDFQDASVYRYTKPGYEYTANANYATYPRLDATAWTASGSNFFRRTLLKFNLSSIPNGAVVQSATLFLYSDPTVTNPNAYNGNSQLSGSNAFYLEKVTGPWSEAAVTWNNQPSTTSTGRVWVGPSMSVTENLQVDIKTFVQEWMTSPSSNYGLKMILENELHYRSRNYGSTDHANSAIHPKLVVTYTVDSDPIKDQMDQVFGALDQSYIPTGILTDYGLDLVDIGLFDGTITPENIMDMHGWRVLYGSLLSSVINPSSNLIHLKTINQTLDNYWSAYDKNNPMVDIPVLFAAYQSLRNDAIDENLISESNGHLYDVPGRPETPYITDYTFAAAPNMGYDVDGNVNFIFRSDLFINSSSKSLNSFQVDFGNGAGYQTLTFNTPVNITYSTDGIKTLKFRSSLPMHRSI